MRKQRGVFIISVLLLTLLTLMFLGSAVALAPGGLGRARQSTEQTVALRAARTGVEYALTRVRQDPQWRGTGNRIVINESDLFVVEQDGQVLGWVADPSGVSGQFRLRFNFYDGNPGQENLPNPSSTYYFPSQSISINNLLGSTDSSCNVTDSAGAPTAVRRVTVPSHSLFLAVEGRCGSALGTLSATNFNPSGSFGPVSSQSIETVYRLSNIGQSPTEAVIQGGGGTNVNLDGTASTLSLATVHNGQPARTRNRSSLEVTNGAGVNLVSTNGEVRASSVTASGSSGVVFTSEQVSDDFYKINYADVHKAATTYTVPGGTYTVDHNGDIDYYAMNLNQYLASVAAPTPTIPNYTFPAGAVTKTTSGGNTKLAIRQDLNVDDTGAVTSFAIIPKRGAKGIEPTGGTASTGLALTAMPYPDPNKFIKGTSGINFLFSNGNSNKKFVYDVVNQAVGGGMTLAGNTTTTNGGIKGQFTLPNGTKIDFKSGNGGTSLVNNTAGEPAMRADFNLLLASLTPALISKYSQQLESLGLSLNTPKDILPTTVTNDATSTANLTIQMAAAGSGNVTLTGADDVVLAATINGTGASITAGKDLKLIGAGFNLTTNPTVGLSLYAKGDIKLTTLQQDLSSTPTQAYRDFNLTGAIYTWGKFDAQVGDDDNGYRDFNLRGALVAYGGDPAGAPTTAGEINIDARNVSLTFDPAYLGDLYGNLHQGFPMQRLTWKQR